MANKHQQPQIQAQKSNKPNGGFTYEKGVFEI